MTLIAARALVKSYGARTLLGGVDVVIREGERVGLVGLNGSGKTTLCRVLGGIEPPDGGEIMRARGASIATLEQQPSFAPGLTARQAVSLGLRAWTEARDRHVAVSQRLARGDGDTGALLDAQAAAAADVERLGGWERDHEVDTLLRHLSVPDPGVLVERSSGGERRRVALAQILIARPDLAILDEPTNHLDVETIAWLEEYLIDEHPGALLLVTHDRYLLDRVATRTLEIDRGEVHDYSGGYGRFLEAKAERQAQAARAESNRQNFLRREIEWLRRQPRARTTKQKARIERAVAARDLAPPPVDRVAELSFEATRSGKTILELHGLAVDVPGRRLIDGLDLVLQQGERLGIVGRNGTGKTSLLRVIVGELTAAAGSVVLGKRTRVAYFDQERSNLDPEKTVFENVAGDQSRIEIGGEVLDTRSWLERFSFDVHQQRQPVSSLSGGERARVALAKLLRQSANLVIFDEPTNDLDVATLAALEQMLVDHRGTTLVVTHDRWFLDRVATAILHLDGSGRALRYPGNYDTFQRLRAERLAQVAAERAVPAALDRTTKKAVLPRQGQSPRERAELDAVVVAIEMGERSVAELEVALGDPALYVQGGDAGKAKRAALQAARAEVERLTARWMELEERR